MRFFMAALLMIAVAACGGPQQAGSQPAAAASSSNASAAAEPPPEPPSPEAQEKADDFAEEAAAAWAQRTDRTSLDKAIILWEKAQVHTPNDPNIATSLARAYYFLGDGALRFAGETDAMLDTFEKGILAGQRALMGQGAAFANKVKAGSKIEDALGDLPAAAEASLYWYASNLGKYASTKGLTTMLFYRDRIFAVMQRALTLDETFYQGGPHRYMGAFFAKAPTFAGGDLAKSKEHFDRALAISPNFFGTKVLYAELYAVRSDDKPLFTKLLKEVIDGDPNTLPDLVAEQHAEQEKARRLLAQTEELF